MSLVVLAQAVWGSIAHSLIGLAQGLGGEAVAQQVRQLLGQRGLDRAVTTAVQKALQRFEDQLRDPGPNHDPELAAALTDNPRFWTNPRLGVLLALAATEAHHHEHHVRELTHAMHAMVSRQISRARCERAARLLIDCVHAEASTISQLQTSLLILRGQEMVAALGRLQPTPEYAPLLHEALVNAANVIAVELEHRYVVSAHLLYALAIQPTGVARKVLDGQHVTSLAVKAVLAKWVRPSSEALEDPWTVGARTALVEARALARDRLADATRTEHVLEVLVNRVLQRGEGSTTLTVVLRDLHLSPEGIRTKLVREGQIVSAINCLSLPPTVW